MGRSPRRSPARTSIASPPRSSSPGCPPRFDGDELEAALAALAGERLTRPTAARTAELARRIAACSYEVEFAPETALAERVLWPQSPSESRGIEDARFVRVEDDGVYRATYTAFDGASIAPQLIETADFRRFRISQLAGPAAQNKGMALFPRRVGGRYVALSRWDRENNAIATSADGIWWGDARTLQTPSRPWELLQLGNCGSPVETEAGWIVLTHGVGPMREYAIGALLLDLDDPSRVVGALRDPLAGARRGRARRLRPQRRLLLRRAAARRPAAAALRGQRRVGPVRRSSTSPLLVERLTGRRATGRDAGEQLRVVGHHPRRGEALLDVVAAVPPRQRADPRRPPRPRRRRRRRGSRSGRGG